MNSTDPNEKSVFNVARSITSPESREGYLSHVCEGNQKLRERVDELLRIHDKGCQLIESAIPSISPTLDLTPVTERPGTKIGPYKLHQEIGEGGMGVVYMAHQREPVRRKVALKIIKPGMDTREVIARFEAERQALAMMDHPNIAKVLEAGATESGRPYFVMELVNGVPITEFSDDNNLTTRERLELFTMVCSAVQHAHQKGIIHRDLKPSNILVTLHDGVPVPKIIDFGIAKAINQELTTKTVVTGLGQMVGTPLYMSPEQAERSGLDVDTRSDIYSLGVLLYELLTGTTPFDKEQLKKAGADEMRRLIREEEPPRPSNRISTMGKMATTVSEHRKTDPVELSNQLRQEVDWIVMKAMEKDRTRRYETATDFVRDIRRYLNDEPVLACPPSVLYRLRKFVRMYRVAVAVTLLVAGALAAGAAIATWQAVEARHAQGLAETQQARAEEAEKRAKTEASIATAISQFLQHDLLAQVSGSFQKDEGFRPKSNLTVREALDRAGSAVESRFSEQPLLEAEIRIVIGQAYRSINENTSAVLHLERATEIRRTLLGSKHPETLESLTTLALAYQWVGRLDDSVLILEQLFQICTATQGAAHEDTLHAMCQLANAYWKDGRWDKAVRLFDHAHEKFNDMFGPNHPSTIGALDGLGVTYRDSRFYAEAIVMLEQVLDKVRRRHGYDYGGTIFSMHRLAIAYQKAGRLEEADQLLRKAIANIPSDDTNALIATANMQSHLALNLMLQEKFVDAEPMLRQAVAAYELESPDSWRRYHAMNLLGGSLLGQHKFEAAEPLLLEGYRGMEERKSHIFGADRPRLEESVERIVKLYEMTNEPEKVHMWRNNSR